MFTVSQLFIYPVKSLGGISIVSAEVTDRGFKHDRRWMLVNENNQFLTQRTVPLLALLQVTITDAGLLIQHKAKQSNITVPFAPSGNIRRVQVWEDICEAVEVSLPISQWFSDILLIKCKLVYMPDSTVRSVDNRYAFDKEITSFSDAYPFLLIGQSSLEDLNSRLKKSLPINRFRPNIVISGAAPFEEDEWAHFSIHTINFYGVKPCARCIVITINQNDATKAEEPLRTLATYRMKHNKIYFGQNLVHSGQGIINIGAQVEVRERKKALFL